MLSVYTDAVGWPGAYSAWIFLKNDLTLIKNKGKT